MLYYRYCLLVGIGIGVSLLALQLQFFQSLLLYSNVVKDDEIVVLFPTYAHEVGSVYHIHINGLIFEEETESLAVKQMRNFLMKGWSLTIANLTDQRRKRFFERITPFIGDGECAKHLTIHFTSSSSSSSSSGSKTISKTLNVLSQGDGYFRDTLELTQEEMKGLIDQKECSIQYYVEADDGRRFWGYSTVPSRKGMGVISDIDDTIKKTEVAFLKKALNNTFFEEFEEAPGMAHWYQQLEGQETERKCDERDVMFYYVSGSPWQLYPALSPFMSEVGFPNGSFHLKEVEMSSPSVLMSLWDQLSFKSLIIEEIFSHFPEKTFILVGDEGEHDPEIYASLAQKYPNQISHIYIRQLPERPPKRLTTPPQSAFSSLPSSLWTIFTFPPSEK